MRTHIRILVFFLLIPVTAAADLLQGVVIATNGQPVADAVVSVEGRASSKTDEGGHFAFGLPKGKYALRISHDGFRTETAEATTGEAINVTLKPALAENIVVSGIRADVDTPVTKSDLTRVDIERDYYGQDIPFLLRDTPSINSYAEGGVGGAGYSYVTLRGISPTRLNFTFDGVPLSDSEDMGTYFVDFPDLGHSLESVQVQRGVGTSTVGSPSFGGSINLESVALSQTRKTDVWLGGGSFGTKLASIGFQSGDMGSFAMYGRLSAQETNGFREHSGVRQHNAFVSVAKQNESSQLRLTGFAGHEYQHESFFAADQDTLKSDLRSNPLSPDDRDSFGYNLAELQYLRSNMAASLYFQRGYGWYRLGEDRYGLDGLLIGSMMTYSATWRGITANYGLHINQFRREHTLDPVGGPRDYFNYGTKGEANAFAKFTYDINRWRLYADAQLRTTDFHYHGDVHIDPIRWTFFNPKVGARYDLSTRSSAYASAGFSTREPARNDLFQGEDNATVPHDLHAVRPERLLDLEAGWDFRGRRGSFAANLYAMEFRHEIASTGELSDIGLLLRRNVDRSYRRGIEIEESLQLRPDLRLRGNANLSRNRIRAWTQFYDVYDTAGTIAGSRPITHLGVNPVLTPTLIINQTLDYTATPRLILSATARYVGKSYLDNTNNGAFTTPSFLVAEGKVAYELTRSMRVTLQMNNVLNSRHVFPSGYSYLFITPSGTIDGVRYYYPQATRNAIAMIDVHL